MSRIAYRLFSSSRLPARVGLNAPARSSRATLTRRMMSSESHASHGGNTPSDTPWIVRFAPSVHRVKLLNVFLLRRLGLHWCSVLWCVHTVDARVPCLDPSVIQFLYLVSPSARKGSHGNHGHKSDHVRDSPT